MANKRKPRALKILQGTLQKVRDRPEPDFPVLNGTPVPLPWLDGPDAVGEWARLAKLLTATRVMTEADSTMLGFLCNLFGAYRAKLRAGEEVNAALMNQLRMFYAEFGLSPSSRSKARPAGDGKAKNPFAVVGTG